MQLKAGLNGIVPQTCGVGVMGIFNYYQNTQTSWAHDVKKAKPQGGAGWLIVSFTNCAAKKEEYKEAYETLKQRWKIVYQSSPRKNKRTGFQFFFCIYDTTKKGA